MTQTTTTKPRLLIAVPTYNEKENAPRLIAEITQLNLDADLLFVDDNSPDGTGQILDKLKAQFPRLQVLHRAGKQGIGSAHMAAIKWAYANKYENLITMDCDFTHPPAKLPELLAAAPGYDIVVASRYINKNSLDGWDLHRKILTKAGHLMTLLLLKIPYDATGGLRFYRLDHIPIYAWDVVSSTGYGFFFESLYIFFLNSFKINQIPIVLPTRTYGESKMDNSEIGRSVKLLFTLFLTTLMNRERFNIIEPMPPESFDKTLQDEQGWDGYWSGKAKVGTLAYDFVAAFYRKFIIRNILNHFIRKHFKENANVLHAGCGSGQVDVDITSYVNITALDISPKALAFYRKTNKDNCTLVHGSIMDIPLKENSLDGIYNLGVMEHFTEEEIAKILSEFHRVLKSGGKAVLLWPPEFGLSVLFFKALTIFFEKVLGRKNVKFHPDEITRLKSKKQGYSIAEAANFAVADYYFGVRDLFTYSVLTIQKP